MKKINFMCTAFRDGFQSVYGGRIFSKDYLPLVSEAVAAGITHFESGGGAMFQSPIFYTNENPFDIMDKFRTAAGPNTNLQTLARGINVVALKSQNSEVIKLHAEMFKKHGITTIRNFDALNDVENLIYSAKAITEAGLKHEVVISMMALPPGIEGAHDADFYENRLRAILDSGLPFTGIAFKDASGTSTPHTVYETIKRARRILGEQIHIVFHSHDTAGTCIAQYLAAIEAGANQVDLSLAPVSGGSCQPDLLSMWHALRGMPYSLDIDPLKIVKLEENFSKAMSSYFVPPEAKEVLPIVPFSPLPGGALTANTQMLRDNGLMDKFDEITMAMGEVVRKGGFGTSVTPVSQFYFQQAFNNVMFGAWQKIAEGYGQMVLGYFGKTPTQPDAEVIKIASEQLNLQPTSEPALKINDANPKLALSAIKAELERRGLPVTNENLFIGASCEEKGYLFLEGKGQVNVRKVEAKPEVAQQPKVNKSNEVTINLNGKAYQVKLEGGKALINGQSYSYTVGETQTTSSQLSAFSSQLSTITAPMPGIILKLNVAEGDSVQAGDTLLVLEAMKMENPIKAKATGVVTALKITQGEQVKAGQALLTIK
ncbi:MAG: biotin/lipoyl-binding protein [Spirochaetaceae bacterium]|nr:biotin/lipoyl-binding protein [Spirochaetaceae bacterium]